MNGVETKFACIQAWFALIAVRPTHKSNQLGLQSSIRHDAPIIANLILHSRRSRSEIRPLTRSRNEELTSLHVFYVVYSPTKLAARMYLEYRHNLTKRLDAIVRRSTCNLPSNEAKRSCRTT